MWISHACDALLNIYWLVKNSANPPVAGETYYILIGISFFFLPFFSFSSFLMKMSIVREGLGRPGLALTLRQWEKKKSQAGINKNASYWERMVLPGKKKRILCTFCERNKRKQNPNCFTEVLTHIDFRSLCLKSQMTHILAFPWELPPTLLVIAIQRNCAKS